MATAPGKVTFYRPGRSFPAVSVTGRRCDLRCDHCRGHYLEGMVPVGSGEQLLALAQALVARGAKGFLLSGGCDPQGKVPFQGYLRAVAGIKAQTRLTVNVHTGLLDSLEEARALVSSGADCFSVDIVQDPDLITNGIHLARGPEDYRRTLELLFAAGAVRVAPHICIGLSGRSTGGELASLRTVSRFPVSSLVLLSFLPARDTPMSGVEPPTPEHVLEVARAAVSTIGAPVIIGCMRPRGDWRLEVELLRAGVRAMAMPSARTVRWAEEEGVEVEWREECCALHQR